MENKTVELKSCPFCGGEAKWWDDEFLGTQAAITCCECGIEKEWQISDYFPYEQRFDDAYKFDMQSCRYKQAAIDEVLPQFIAAWNTRASSINPVLVEEIVGALKDTLHAIDGADIKWVSDKSETKYITIETIKNSAWETNIRSILARLEG